MSVPAVTSFETLNGRLHGRTALVRAIPAACAMPLSAFALVLLAGLLAGLLAAGVTALALG
ncbi:MAG: hypothetical protein PSV40_08810 [Polaromonas sp.]|uniref:hypothetical protein n=1 Tax=Polaromonas sp. TaxID=1869339 RepID=UPI002486D16A|nr:hypothetical protein [Polaromonas sp.]MDI1269189.1 hypothetical protein [Polaromonas sp.]